MQSKHMAGVRPIILAATPLQGSVKRQRGLQG